MEVHSLSLIWGQHENILLETTLKQASFRQIIHFKYLRSQNLIMPQN